MSLSTPATAVEPLVHQSGAACVMLDEGRWHFQHGPIDLIIGADGEAADVRAALAGAWGRFTQILPELVAELRLLRSAARPGMRAQGPVAARMLAACEPYAPPIFVTPMAAVAGSVAEEIIAFFAARPGIWRAYVNNGGDIALHLGPGHSYRVGLFSDLSRYQGQAPALDGEFAISARMPIRGIATSGWRGRSLSLGIADSVTVLAAAASGADVAATLIANQVYVDHAAVRRAPADTLKDDTDLGSRLVTVDVGPLPQAAIGAALGRGAEFARSLHRKGLIQGAVLTLQGSARVVGIDTENEEGRKGDVSGPDFKAVAGRSRPARYNAQKENHV